MAINSGMPFLSATERSARPSIISTAATGVLESVVTAWLACSISANTSSAEALCACSITV
ncbi:Uncharacterised protein [Vibrio cholerae]|nr:Uncharacterised protein [Vibrio cholerae]